LPFACWTLDRLVVYLSDQGIAMRRSRISEIFIREGLKWRHDETWFGARVDPDFAKKGGHRAALHGAANRQRSRLPGRDGGGPELSRPAARQAGSAQGWAGQTFKPASGEAFTHPYDRRTATNDFLGEVEAWIDPAVARIYAVADNLSTHSAPDVLLFSLLHPRWEFVFQPKYAAYLNLVRPELPMFQYPWALAA
jgi:hypothetical protein